MAQFLRVHNRAGLLHRINVEHIVRYCSEELPEKPGELVTIIFLTGGGVLYVRELPPELDRLLEPTRV